MRGTNQNNSEQVIGEGLRELNEEPIAFTMASVFILFIHYILCPIIKYIPPFVFKDRHVTWLIYE